MNEVTTASCYSLSPHIRYREVGGEGIILDQRAAEMIVVNALGEQILKLLKGKPTFKEIIGLLHEEYDVDADILATDVSEYLHQLLSAGIIEELVDD